MKIVVFLIWSVILSPLNIFCQQITYADYEREDSKDINFEVIGKMHGNFLVYKNIRWKHNITVYDNDMRIKEKINLDFIPDKTFNIDFLAYPDFFYMVYQYQKRNILHCVAQKMNADGKRLGNSQELDTTQIGILADNKIYSTNHSEDKQKIIIYKIQKKNERLNLTTLLFDNQLSLIRKSREEMNYEDRRDVLGELLVDNQGTIIFTRGMKAGNRDYINDLSLVIKEPLKDSLQYYPIHLDKFYVDDVELKIDNLNGHYLLNSFFYKQRRGNIDGLFTYVWNKATADKIFSAMIEFNDSLRIEAKKDGQYRYAFNDFFIRQVIVKKDGSYLLTAEDYSLQSRGNTNGWNRYDYLYSPYFSQYDNYLNSSPYNWYRPYNTYNNVSTRYYYDNIMILSIDKNSTLQWSSIIHKNQFDDDNDNYLSFGIMNSGGEIHFLFNTDVNKNQLLADHSFTSEGNITRNPPLKSQDKGYKFMPRFAKQVGARQVILPCNYRGYIVFAKIDF